MPRPNAVRKNEKKDDKEKTKKGTNKKETLIWICIYHSNKHPTIPPARTKMRDEEIKRRRWRTSSVSGPHASW